MKKKNHYIIISTLTLAVTLLSCGNLLDKTPVQKGQITITLNTPGRTVSPVAAVDITAITEWDVTVTQNETEVLKEKLSAQNGSISIQLPAGTYTFSVEGTDGNSDVTFSGSAENVPVNSQTASVSIVVYPKKTEGGEGNFLYTINLAGEINQEGIKAALKSIADSNINISIENIQVNGKTITLEASSVSSDFYLLSVTYYDQAVLLGDELIEICTGVTTTGTAENVEFIKETDPYVSATGTGDGSRPWLPGKIIDFVDAVEDAIPTPEVDLIYVDKSIPPIAFTDRTKDGTVMIGFFSNDNPSVTRYKCTLSVSSGQGTKTLSIDAAHLAEQGGITVAKGNQIELLEPTLSDGETIVLTLDKASPPAIGDTIISKKNCTEEIAQRFLVGDGSKYKISSSGTLISAESPYAAWNQQRVLYVDNTADNLISASAPAVAMTYFCFDWDNNIYVYTSNQKIIKIPQGETYTEATPMPLTGPTNTVSIACDNGNLYVLECSPEQPPTVRLWQYKCADFGGTETPVSGTPIELSASGLDLSVHKPVIAAADSTIYLAAPYPADNTWKVSAWTINDDGTTITAEQKYSSDVDLLQDLKLSANPEISVINGSSVDWDTFRVSDLLVQDGAVYALLSEVTDEFITSSPNTSRGAVVKLTDTGSALSVDTSFGSKGLLGWTDTAQQFNYAYEEADAGQQVSGTVDCYWPASDNTNGFYGPAKFVAVKPKKLVIADDGATGIPYNKSELSSTTGEIYQKDRIVEVDLSSGTISETVSFTEEQPINFDIYVLDGSGWFD